MRRTFVPTGGHRLLQVEEARLRVLFPRLLALSLSVPLGCSSGDDSTARKDASSSEADATTTLGDSGRGDATLGGIDGGSGASSDADGPRDSACDPVYLDGEADGSGCDFFERLACNLPPGTPTEGCAIFLVSCTQICHQTEGLPCAVSECSDAGVIPSGPITVECTTGKIGCADGGRRPAGLVEPRARGAEESPLGGWLARLAWMEAASVHAFRALRAELGSLNAPAPLLRAAELAEGDEVRHARIMSRLARRHGATRARARVKPRRQRPLAAFARENAVEGCVRETYGALVASWQSRHAPDVELARAMEEIAADETRHAALAWATARWLEPRLSAASRQSVRASMEGALRALRCEVATLPPRLAREAGLPSGGERGEAVRLVDALARALLA